MKRCELCSLPARMYCDSDKASLCWGCDEKVHSANFLVAKHSRSLLCHSCQSPTSWTAAGMKIGRTVSVCESCVGNCNLKAERGGQMQEERQGRNEDEINDIDGDDEYSSDSEDDDDESEHSDSDVEDGENQVVPWSPTPSPPPVACSSSSVGVSSSRFSAGDGRGVAVSKRLRENADLKSEDEFGCSSSLYQQSTATAAMISRAPEEDDNDDEATSPRLSRRPLKIRRTSPAIESGGEPESRTAAIVKSLKMFQKRVCGGPRDLEFE